MVERDDLAFVHDSHAAAHLFGFLEVVRGEEHSGALRLVDFPNKAPELPAELHVHAGGGLVEDQQPRLMDQSFRHHEPALHPARQFVHRFFQVRTQSEALDQELAPDGIVGHAVVARVELERHVDREKSVDDELLVHHAGETTRLHEIPLVVLTEHGNGAAADPGYTRDHVDRGALACAVRAQ